MSTNISINELLMKRVDVIYSLYAVTIDTNTQFNKEKAAASYFTVSKFILYLLIAAVAAPCMSFSAYVRMIYIMIL